MAKTSKRRFEFRHLVSPGAHWIWLSIVLYVIACFLPAMPPIIDNTKITGWQCLASLMFVIPAWWANPTYFLALVLQWRRFHRAAATLAVIAALLALTFQLLDVPNFGWAIADQEIGCYVWIISMQILAWNLVWQEWISWRQRQEQLNLGPVDGPCANDVAPTTSVLRPSSPLPLEPSTGRSPE